jgi:glycerol-3-phosphate dehydrogenase
VNSWDVIVVGGGINGSGIARDAALRGLKVLLLEKDDFASGASGKNGRMIHGGLRYLEQGEIGLVREALHEREVLLRIAPHLVKPRALLIPIRQSVGRPFWMVRAGLLALDILAGWRAPRHAAIGRAETLRRVPTLDPQGLRGAAIMFDAVAEFSERLTIENLLDAAALGARVENYHRVDHVLLSHGKVEGVRYTDLLSGVSDEARAPIVINATGAWVDELLTASTGNNAQLLGASKGTFIVVREFAGAPTESVFFEARRDRRPIIVTPWNGLYLIGTTDSRIAGLVDDQKADQTDIDYLTSEVSDCFPAAQLGPDSVLYSYTGVRPLPFSGGASRKVTRRHVIHDHAATMQGLFSVLGGKLSTFRSLADDMLGSVLTKLGRRSQRCVTDIRPLPGAQTENYDGFAAAFMQGGGLSLQTRRRLLSLYGVRSDLVVAMARQDPALAEVIDSETGAIAAEPVFAVKTEWAKTFTDILIRRTMIGRNSDQGAAVLPHLCRLAASHLGWDATRIDKNLEQYRAHIELGQRFAHDPALAAPVRQPSA